MKNREIAKIFSEMATILELRDDNVFKIRAYRKAALNLESLTQSVEALSHKELLNIPGVGADLAAKIEEYLQTGRMTAYEEMKKTVPEGLQSLLAVPDLGPKTAKLLYETLGITSIDELERAAAEHRLAGIRGIQQRTEEKLLNNIRSLKRGRERFPLGRMLPAAQALVDELKKRANVNRIEIAGSIRRRRETIRDIDLVATAPVPASVMEAFVALPQVTNIMMRGATRSSVMIDEGVQVDLRVVDPGSFGAALAYLTGSKQHNVRLREMAVKRGLRINEYGVYREDGVERLGGENEEDIYRLLDLPFIAPELREDQGEVEAALEGRLPQLLTLADLRGDLHVHSKWSDGSHSIADVAAAALAHGLSYIAITDHSRGLGVTGGLTIERLMEQGEEIAAFNKAQSGCTVLRGTEMEIHDDGTLDYPDEVLQRLEFVVAAAHTGFHLTKEQNTARLIGAIRNPWVSMIAHPTGRVIGEREPYPVDMEAVLQAARETGTALEISSWPLRLDLNDRDARRAKELGVRLAITSDTHAALQFDTLPYGISVAQRAWLEKGDLLNAMELPELMKWVRSKKGRK